MRNRQRVAVVTLACMLALGCNSRREAKQAELERDRRSVTAESTHDASAAIVDESYRFRLDVPGEGWKTLGEADARKANPDFLAMAVKSPGLFAGVSVEHLPGVSFDAWIELLEAGELGFGVESQERTRFGDHEAARIRYTLDNRGLPVTTREALLIIRGEYHYRVEVWRADGPVNSADADRVFAAFSLLDGEVVPREPELAALADSHGVGWMVRDGVFRSIVSGLELEAPAPTRLLVGPELHDMQSLAEVGFMQESPSFVVLLYPQPSDLAPIARSREALSESLAAEYPSAHEVAALELTIAGARVPVDGWDEGPIRYYTALFDLADRRMMLQAWWPSALDERNRETLVEVASRLRIMDEATRDATAVALAELPDPQEDVGPGWTIRGGRYLDFERGVSWAKPRMDDAAWLFLTGEDAAAWDSDAAIVLFELRSGRSVILSYIDGVGSLDEDGWRRQIATSWPGIRELRRKPLTVAGTPAELLVADVDVEEQGRRPAYLVTLRRGELGVALLHESPGAIDEELFTEGILAGFELHEELVEIERRAGRWIDHRFGVALEPPSAWIPKDSTLPPLAGFARMTTWMQGGREKLLLLAIHPPQFGQDLDSTQSFVEQLARDSFGVATWDLAKRREVTIAGLPGRELSWSKPPTSVTMTRKNGTLLIAFTSTPEDSEVRRVLSSIEFVE